MIDHVPCPYCLEIAPIDKARKGKINRCPLCKTEILETPSGQSYRLRTDEGEEIPVPEHAGWSKWLTSLFAGSST